MLRILIGLIITAATASFIFYKAPGALKQEVSQKISEAIPETVKEKIAPIIYTPAERRAKLIEKLENDLAELKSAIAQNNIENLNEIVDKFENSEKIVSQIKKTNEEQSIANKITTSIVNEATGILNPNIERQTKSSDCDDLTN